MDIMKKRKKALISSTSRDEDILSKQCLLIYTQTNIYTYIYKVNENNKQLKAGAVTNLTPPPKPRKKNHQRDAHDQLTYKQTHNANSKFEE